ncbi:MAG: hypothetical protein KKA07_08165, partial [Bacteroidetes bacterium]|nr:hypothetical protein [Bacteroidota bacterium]
MKFTKSLILLLLIAFSLNLNAQGYSMRELGTPQIRNYSQNDYKAYSQNWGAVQDYRGLMYFANGNGVLEYDGVSWKMIPVTGNMPVYGIAIDNEQVIYVGNAVDFGYLAPNQKSDLEFVSLLENIAPADRDFSIKGKILATNEGVFYKTRNRLFRWNNEKMTCWRLSDTSSCHFVNDHVYVWEVHTGLQILMGDSLRKLREDPFFRDREIISMLPYSSEQTMICTREEGLFLVKNRGLQFPRVNIQPEPFRSPASEFLISNWLLSSIKLKNGYFAFGTLQGGSVVIDAKGDIVQFLNTEIGILNDTHIALAEDSYGALWIAMDNGISRTDISSPVSFWNDDAGLKGSVIKAARLNGELFVATYQGLYHMISPTRKEEEKEIPNSFLFKPVKNMGLQCWDILPVEDTVNPENSRLLIANARGLYVVDNQLNVLLLEAGSYYKVIQSKLSPGRFYAGRDDGVLMFESVDGSAKNFNVIGMVPGLNEKVVSIGEDSDGTIWLGARYKGFIGLRINILTSDKDKRNISDFSFRKAIYDTSAGLPASEEYLLFKYQNRLICITEGGMYRFINTDVHDPLKGNFVHDYSPTNGYPNDYYFVYSLIEDKKGDLWMQLISKELKKKIIVHAVRLGNGFYKYIVAPFRQIPYMDIYTINVEKDGTTWFGGDDGLFRYDTKLIYDYDKSYSVHIRRIVMEGDSVIFRGAFARRDSLNPDRVLLATTQQEDEIPLFASRENSFLFEFAAPVYTDESRNLYRYYLEGFDKDWSDWTSQTSKEYTNLPHGRYVFHIRAKNVYENESDEALFEFSILTPWYMTAWAYILYFLLFGALSYTGVRFSNIRLRKAKARLENIVR